MHGVLVRVRPRRYFACRQTLVKLALGRSSKDLKSRAGLFERWKMCMVLSVSSPVPDLDSRVPAEQESSVLAFQSELRSLRKTTASLTPHEAS